MMSKEWDQQGLSGKGIRVGIIDEVYKDFRRDEQTRGVQVFCHNFVTNDTTGFLTGGLVHGMWVARNLGGKNGREVWGLAYVSGFPGNGPRCLRHLKQALLRL